MSKQIEFNEAARRAMEAGVDKLADAVRVTIGPRWTLLLEYPKQFLLIPVSLIVVGLILFGFGMTAESPGMIVLLVYTAYVAWLTAIVSFILMLLFMRPDQDGT